MKTKKAYPLFGLVCAIGLTIVQNIFAQTVRQRQRTEVMHMTLPEQQKAKEDFAKRYPLVANRMELHRGMQTGVQSVKPVADVIRSHRKPSIMKMRQQAPHSWALLHIYTLIMTMPTTVSARSIPIRLRSTSLSRTMIL